MDPKPYTLRPKP